MTKVSNYGPGTVQAINGDTLKINKHLEEQRARARQNVAQSDNRLPTKNSESRANAHNELASKIKVTISEQAQKLSNESRTSVKNQEEVATSAAVQKQASEQQTVYENSLRNRQAIAAYRDTQKL